MKYMQPCISILNMTYIVLCIFILKYEKHVAIHIHIKYEIYTAILFIKRLFCKKLKQLSAFNTSI